MNKEFGARKRESPAKSVDSGDEWGADGHHASPGAARRGVVAVLMEPPDRYTGLMFKRSFIDDFTAQILRQIKAFSTSLGQVRGHKRERV